MIITDLYDVIVVGLGAHGSAALYHLMRQAPRIKVLGIDRFQPPHTMGSSHGESRFIRLSSSEGEGYTQMAIRSLELIRELEALTKQTCYLPGGQILGPRGHPFFEKTIAIAKQHQLDYHLYQGQEIAYPQILDKSHITSYIEYAMGTLFPERIINAHCQLAQQAGADIHTDETVIAIEHNHHVTVNTNKGRYACKQLILAVNARLHDLFPHMTDFHVHPAMQLWFEVNEDYRKHYHPKNFPATIRLVEDNHAMLLFPDFKEDNTVKLAPWQIVADKSEAISAEECLKPISDDAIQQAYERFIQPYFAGINPHCVKAVPCHYTVAPHYQFQFTQHPESKNITIVNACSGHGFKHCAAIGEKLAAQALGHQLR